MNKHIPGPWSIGEVSHKKQRVDIDSLHADPTLGHQEWHGLARVYGSKEMPEEGSATMLANARLIAAAPDLLAALEALLDYENGIQKAKAEQMAYAAIAKAGGAK